LFLNRFTGNGAFKRAQLFERVENSGLDLALVILETVYKTLQFTNTLLKRAKLCTKVFVFCGKRAYLAYCLFNAVSRRRT